MTVAITDSRRPPFLWIANSAKAAIKTLPVRDQPYAVAVYVALAALASRFRDGDHAGFQATRQEVADEAGMSTKTLDVNIKSLVELGLLGVERRREGSRNQPNLWRLLTGPSGNTSDTLNQDLRVTSGDDLPSSEEASNDPPLEEQGRNGSKGKNHVAPEVRRLCQLMADLQNERSGTSDDEKGYEVSPRWEDDMRKLLEIDGRPVKQVEAALRWIHQHPFESGVVLSPGKLRARYTDLRTKAIAEAKKRASRGDKEAERRARTEARLRGESL